MPSIIGTKMLFLHLLPLLFVFGLQNLTTTNIPPQPPPLHRPDVGRELINSVTGTTTEHHPPTYFSFDVAHQSIRIGDVSEVASFPIYTVEPDNNSIDIESVQDCDWMNKKSDTRPTSHKKKKPL
ncbi:unnamed protein product [Lactuca saligna]|uniref:Uncharacterized protein n=1 Tax=Lactuca saligna TaxID=75948 RepID=A0AA35Z924_LACSI|nr:unnamed protein product [Lactuca saligna]